MPTWQTWLQAFPRLGPSDRDSVVGFLELPQTVLDRTWEPSAADRKQGWEFYTELRTRITTQPLHYTEGDEGTALKSLYELFGIGRDLIRKGGPEARHFATLVAFFLNKVVRPVTARWHKESECGNLDNEDVRHEFRERLEAVQARVRLFGSVMGKLAEGDDKFSEESESWPRPGQPLAPRQIDLGADIPFDRLLFDAAVGNNVPSDILQAETEEIRARRIVMQQTGDGTATNLAGLAISGGGLRSATFALGVVQALSERNMLGQFDYLSTVSGGGYLGSFLSNYLNTPNNPDEDASQNGGPRHPDVGPNGSSEPFRKPAVGESAALRHLRSQSKFILNGGTIGRFRMVLQALFGMLTNAAIAFPWIAIAVLAAGMTMGSQIRDAANLQRSYDYFHQLLQNLYQVMVSAVMVLLLVLLPPVLRWSRRDRWVQLGAGYLIFTSLWLAFCLIVTAWNSIPGLFRLAERVGQLFIDTSWLPGTFKSQWMALFTPAALHAVGRVIGVAGRQKPWVIGLKKLITRITGPLILLLVFVLLGREVILNPGETIATFPLVCFNFELTTRQLTLFFVTVGFLIYDHLFLDINLSSLHPFYRARLAEAYLVQHSAGDNVKAADRTRLSHLRRHPQSKAPYHLLNAALNSPSGRHRALRGRHCDFFLFSKHYCGSASTGYHPTTEFEALDPALNLGTAMAISGAAASPFMGTGSGETSFLLALFNIRLDYWLQFPTRRAIPLISWKPGPWYLLKQLLGRVDEKSTYVNLSDGGHIENLAIYELLRRRCKFIVAVDGECDPMITTGSLLTLMNYAKIDFGIDIKFAYAGGLDRLKPSSLHTRSLTEKHAGEAAEPKASEASDERPTKVAPVLRSPMLPYHFALAHIDYPTDPATGIRPRGWLLYLKSSLTGNEGPTISYYRSKYPAFPHESTSDLFYDEEQFEAYRSLGHHIAEDLFRNEITGPAQTPQSIRDWFAALKDKMTNPSSL